MQKPSGAMEGDGRDEEAAAGVVVIAAGKWGRRFRQISLRPTLLDIKSTYSPLKLRF